MDFTDLPKKIELVIFKKDLLENKYCNVTECPIAMAVRRKVNNPTIDISCGSEEVTLATRKGWIDYNIKVKDNKRVEHMSTPEHPLEPKRFKMTVTKR